MESTPESTPGLTSDRPLESPPEPLREVEIFAVLRAIESGAVVAHRGAVLISEGGVDDVEIRTSSGWRFVVALESGQWGGIVQVDAPDGRRIVLGEGLFSLEDMPALCDYRPEGDALARWLAGSTPTAPRHA